jgi:hypothetical protein
MEVGFLRFWKDFKKLIKWSLKKHPRSDGAGCPQTGGQTPPSGHPLDLQKSMIYVPVGRASSPARKFFKSHEILLTKPR